MIDWNTVITAILASSSITVIVIAVMGFVGKSIFAQILLRDIEKYKSSREIELERFRADLQKAAFEHQTRYQNLHSKRAEVIQELYCLLVQAERDAISLSTPFTFEGEPSKDEKFQQAHKSGKALYHFFERNRIYFKPESCERIAKFVQELHQSIVGFNFVLDALSHQNAQLGTEKWVKIWAKLSEELPPIKADLEKEFREILGL